MEYWSNGVMEKRATKDTKGHDVFFFAFLRVT
jgi:hypothetical protein